jgi:8-oxo-dGTP diphosphatase
MSEPRDTRLPAAEKPRRLRVGAYALIHEAGRIVLCRISPELPRWAGAWTLPGGGLDFGESPESAMIREVEEETGLLVRATSIAAVDSIYDETEHECFQAIRIIYQCEIVSGRLRHEASGSTDRCEWHALHTPLSIPLGDLAEVGIRLARQLWPE